jgi:MoxR-like ATPase
MTSHLPRSIEDTVGLLARSKYVADRALATVVYLALKMGKPLFLEGEAGVGKTEIAKVLAQALDRDLIRLQCYEGLDVNTAVYEWNYPAQMIDIRLAEATGVEDRAQLASTVFSERFLIRRPLLQALQGIPGRAPVLLVDELDRTDEAFEAFLLEVLSDFQVTIPELGTIIAERRPMVVLTSNATRELSEALKRRCLYLALDYPSAEREREIVLSRVPDLAPGLAEQLVRTVRALRALELKKSPSISETLDWAQTLLELGLDTLDESAMRSTLGVVLKHASDQVRAAAELRLN